MYPGLIAFVAITTAGCFQAPPPPAAPPAQSAGRDSLPALPPDPRGGGVSSGTAPDRSAVGTKPLPAKPVAGSVFNKLFPKDGDGYNVTYTQEKSGASLAELTKGGKKLAQLSITDTAGNPPARDKFKTGSQAVAGFPAASVGDLGTAILVGDRFQVQVRSADPAFTADQRAAWLAKFDLAGLQGVQ
jgi:hypothetical protein